MQAQPQPIAASTLEPSGYYPEKAISSSVVAAEAGAGAGADAGASKAQQDKSKAAVAADSTSNGRTTLSLDRPSRVSFAEELGATGDGLRQASSAGSSSRRKALDEKLRKEQKTRYKELERISELLERHERERKELEELRRLKEQAVLALRRKRERQDTKESKEAYARTSMESYIDADAATENDLSEMDEIAATQNAGPVEAEAYPPPLAHGFLKALLYFFKKAAYSIKGWLKWRYLYYYYIHVVYIVVMGFLGGLALVISENYVLPDSKRSPLQYVDAMFIAFSSNCVTGLSTVDFSTFSILGYVLVWLLIISGSLVMTPLPATLIKAYRARYRMNLRKKEVNLAEAQYLRYTRRVYEQHREGAHEIDVALPDVASGAHDSNSNTQDESIRSSSVTSSTTANSGYHLIDQGISIDQVHPLDAASRTTYDFRRPVFTSDSSQNSREKKTMAKIERKRNKRISAVLKYRPPPAESIEYLALMSIFFITLFSSLFIVLSCFIALGFWFYFYYSAYQINSVSPWWLGLFLATSAFCNAGFIPFSDNMMRFVSDWYVNLIVTFLTIVGNTLFPALTRFLVTVLYKFGPRRYRLVMKYLLVNHHHMSYHLFPGLQTRLYFATTIILYVAGTVLGMISDYNAPLFASQDTPGGTRFLAFLFQTGSTRSAGFNTVDLSQLSFATLLVYIILMRIKPTMFCSLTDRAYGISTILRRFAAVRQGSKRQTDPFPKPQGKYMRSNTEEDLKLLAKSGVVAVPALEFDAYRKDEQAKVYNIIEDVLDYGPVDDSATDTVSVSEEDEATLWGRLKITLHRWLKQGWGVTFQFLGHMKSIMLQNNAWLFLVVLMICLVEVDRMRAYPVDFSFFKILFEVVSAFGNVGLTLGYPGVVFSFSGVMNTFSKLLIIFVMILGRHRGMIGSMKDQEYSDYTAADLVRWATDVASPKGKSQSKPKGTEVELSNVRS